MHKDYKPENKDRVLLVRSDESRVTSDEQEALVTERATNDFRRCEIVRIDRIMVGINHLGLDFVQVIVQFAQWCSTFITHRMCRTELLENLACR